MNGAYLEVVGRPGDRRIPLDRDRVTIGKAASNDGALYWDATVSRLHAVIERFASGWCVRDVGSRNGTFVNAERIAGDRVLRPGDEIRLGETRLVFRPPSDESEPVATMAADEPPQLTRRERDVLVALSRPILRRTLLSEPSTVREIAVELQVTESAVKKYLGRLYDRFGLERDDRRRGRLVSEAIRRGAVGTSDA